MNFNSALIFIRENQQKIKDFSKNDAYKTSAEGIGTLPLEKALNDNGYIAKNTF